MFQYCKYTSMLSSLSKTTHLLGINVGTWKCIHVSLRIFQKGDGRGSYVCDSKCRKHNLKMQAAFDKRFMQMQMKAGERHTGVWVMQEIE